MNDAALKREIAVLVLATILAATGVTATAAFSAGETLWSEA